MSHHANELRILSISFYSKTQKYMDSCSVKKPSLPLARIVSSPFHNECPSNCRFYYNMENFNDP